VKAVDSMVNGADFIETFRLLTDNYQFEAKTAYFITMRVFRGGGLTKDAVYLTGLINLLKYLQNGGNLELLYSGKFHLKHIPVIQELMHRKILRKPFLGHYFGTESAQNQIKKLQHITDLTQLINSNTYEHRVHH
jgi:hypothetical protein